MSSGKRSPLAASVSILLVLFLAVLVSSTVSASFLTYDREVDTWKLDAQTGNWLHNPDPSTLDSEDNATTTIYIEAPENGSRINPGTSIAVVSFNISAPIVIVENNGTTQEIVTASWKVISLSPATVENTTTISIHYLNQTLLHRTYIVKDQIPIVENTPETQQAGAIIDETAAREDARQREKLEEAENAVVEAEVEDDVDMATLLLHGALIAALVVVAILLAKFFADRCYREGNGAFKNPVLAYPIIIAFLVAAVIVVYIAAPTMASYNENKLQHQAVDKPSPIYEQVLGRQPTAEERLIMHQLVDDYYPVDDTGVNELYMKWSKWLQIAAIFSIVLVFAYNSQEPGTKPRAVLQAQQRRGKVRFTEDLYVYNKGPMGLQFRIAVEDSSFWRAWAQLLGWQGYLVVPQGATVNPDIIYEKRRRRRRKKQEIPADEHDREFQASIHHPLVRKYLYETALASEARDIENIIENISYWGSKWWHRKLAGINHQAVVVFRAGVMRSGIRQMYDETDTEDLSRKAEGHVVAACDLANKPMHPDTARAILYSFNPEQSALDTDERKELDAAEENVGKATALVPELKKEFQMEKRRLDAGSKSAG